MSAMSAVSFGMFLARNLLNAAQDMTFSNDVVSTSFKAFFEGDIITPKSG